MLPDYTEVKNASIIAQGLDIGFMRNDGRVQEIVASTYFNPDVFAFNDYYPYGMLLNNRHGSVDADAYRYGFNGMERDEQVKGEGNSYDYIFRMYDNRLGRFFSTDILTYSYPMLSPYQFAGNRPIDGIDVDGKEWAIRTTTNNSADGKSINITHEMICKLKVQNQSTIVTAPNTVKANAEIVKKDIEKRYSGKFTSTQNGVTTTTIYKTTVVLDHTPKLPSSDPDYNPNIGELIFTDATSTKKTITQKTVSGTKTTTTTTTTAGYNIGQINKFMSHVASTIDGKIVPTNDLAETGSHEVGHSGGLNHPWELEAHEIGTSLLDKLNQLDAKNADPNVIKANLMNSDENPDPNLRSTSGTTLLQGQLDALVKRIKQRAVFDYEELEPKPKAKPNSNGNGNGK